MESSDALKILRVLADGIDPTTGEVFESDSPYQHPIIIRALFAGIQALERVEKRRERERILPSNAGKAWSEDEDKELVEFFKRGVTIADLSRKHQRTIGSIESRLIRHGLIEQKST
jgi:hypothetical protein